MKPDVAAFLHELNNLCRKHGVALDIGDGNFLLYRVEDYGHESLATLGWSKKTQGVRSYTDEPDWWKEE